MRDTFHLIVIKIVMTVIVPDLKSYKIEREIFWIYAVIFH